MRPSTFRIAAAAIILVTLVRVAATHRVFSETMDETAHVATGHEWLTSSTYRIEPSHPPLARIILALPFREIPPFPDRFGDFSRIFFGNPDTYVQNLVRARRGNLVFLLMAMIVTAAWARRLFGKAAALIALVFLGSLPPVLAHAGLATTDMAAAATFIFALYALDLLLDEPTWRRAIILGIAIGCGLSSKFSFIPFFPIAALIQIGVRRRLPSPRAFASVAIALLMLWGIYKFSWGTMDDEYHGMSKATEEVMHSSRAAFVPLPAPAMFTGIITLKKHDMHGHKSYALGKFSQNGFWYFFPLALGAKTPLPALLLFAIGAFVLVRSRRRNDLVLTVFAILAYSMTAHINIGVRHMLPLYPLMAIVAGAGGVILTLSVAKGREPEVSVPGPSPLEPVLRRASDEGRLRMTRAALLLLMLWLVADGALAHPDYLPWFNALAGSKPYEVLIDSNLDWGQDLLRLARACREKHIDHLGAELFTNSPLEAAGLPSTTQLLWYVPQAGWAAISEQDLQLARAQEPLAFMWLTEGRRYERIGASIRLYYVK